MRAKSSNRISLIMWLIVIFLCIIAVFSHILFGTYAKYNTSQDFGDGARVARWSPSAVLEDSNELRIVKGNSEDTYTFTVTSESEVANTYSVILRDVPQGVSVTIGYETQTADTANAELTFENVGSFEASPEVTSAEHTITFSADLGTVPREYTIPINVTFTQID